MTVASQSDHKSDCVVTIAQQPDSGLRRLGHDRMISKDTHSHGQSSMWCVYQGRTTVESSVELSSDVVSNQISCRITHRMDVVPSML